MSDKFYFLCLKTWPDMCHDKQDYEIWEFILCFCCEKFKILTRKIYLKSKNKCSRWTFCDKIEKKVNFNSRQEKENIYNWFLFLGKNSDIRREISGRYRFGFFFTQKFSEKWRIKFVWKSQKVLKFYDSFYENLETLKLQEKCRNVYKKMWNIQIL